MSASLKRLIFVLAALPVLLLVVAALYMLGMAMIEGSPRSFMESLQWAAETLTTVGYGKENSWDQPLMVLYVVTVQFLGALLVFLVVPIALVPFLEKRFEVKLPREVPRLDDHLVIYGYSPAVSTFLDAASMAGVEYLVVEDDPVRARRLLEQGRRVVYEPNTDNVHDRAHVANARALVANGTDDQNASLIVGARQAGFEGEIVALVEEPVHRRPMSLAGATAVFTPRHVLGAALAARASDRIAPTVAGIQQLGRHLRTLEVRIEPGSSLEGRTLAEAAIGRETGATVLGQWTGGRLQGALSGDDEMVAGGILVIAGSEESLGRVEVLCEGTRSLTGKGPFVVGGFGEVGQKVVQLLHDAGEETCVIDRTRRQGVDIVGDVLEMAILEQLDLAESKGVILALDTDTATLFATVIIRDLAPEVPVIVRVNQARNVRKIHGAGADFALSLSQVSGQILQRRLLGQETISFDAELRLSRESTRRLVGRTVKESRIREQTGCSVVAVERGDDLLVEFGPDFEFESGDDLYICGNVAAIDRFRSSFVD